MTEKSQSRKKWGYRTRKVWDRTAHIYDRWVTSTKNRMLKLYIVKEQKMLDDHLTWLVSRIPERKISLLEIGSGTGRTLLEYAHKPALIERMEYLIGVDEASAMCEIAKYKLSQIASMINSNG
jgi:SAM-dependent methyltransferase